jgi:hypothetical protein
MERIKESQIGLGSFSMLFWGCDKLSKLFCEDSLNDMLLFLNHRVSVFNKVIGDYNGYVVKASFNPCLAIWEEDRPVSKQVLDTGLNLLQNDEINKNSYVSISHGKCMFQRDKNEIVVFGDAVNSGFRLNELVVNKTIRFGVDSKIVEDFSGIKVKKIDESVYEILI